MLTEAQIREVVDFDRDYRAFNCGGRTSRRTLRYNLIVPEAPHAPGERAEVSVVHVAVRLNQANTPLVMDVARADLEAGVIRHHDIGYRMIAGWIVYWDRADILSKKVAEYICPPGDGSVYTVPYRVGGPMTFPYAPTVNPDALKGTRYEYCQWGGPYGLVDWLMLYRREPRIELLAKLGVSWLCTPAAAKALHRPEVRRYLTDNIQALASKRRIYTVREFLWGAMHGVTLREAHLHYRTVQNFRPYRHAIRDIHFDYDRVGRMLPKWNASPQEYTRYLEYARDTGLDMKCEGVLYPPVGSGRTSFHARLERLEAEYDRRMRAERRRAAREAREREEARRRELAGLMAARIEEIDAFQKSLDASRVVDLGRGVKVQLSRSQDDLRAEGRKMHNCVGMGHYGEGIVMGRTLIVMFRKDGKPFCDAEIDRVNWSVRQCYFAHNRPATPEYHAAAKLVADHLKALVKSRTRRKVAKKRRAS